MQSIILAGGLGTRLRPLTHKTPKCMTLINNKPFLEYQLLLLKKQGINSILLCVAYLHEQIQNYFGDGKKWGLTLQYSVEEQPLGTGGALKKAQVLLQDRFLLLYGDSYLPIAYKDIITAFTSSKKKGLMVVYDNHDTHDTKNNVRVEQGEVKSYDKKEPRKDFNGVEAGVLVFKKEIIDLMPPQESFSLEEEIFPKLIQQNQMGAFMIRQKFYDIGTVRRLKDAEKILTNEPKTRLP